MADYNVRGKMTLDTGSFISSAQSASNSLNGLNTNIGNTSNSLKYLKRGVLAAGVALGGLGAAGIKAASDYQQSMVAFTKMMGSAEKATQFVKELQDFAAATPFELPQVQLGAKKLMAMGFAAEQVLPMLTSIGDAASGLSLGAEGIDRLTLAIGQMSAKGKVAGGELRQLQEAGIPVLQYLADAYGKTTAEITKMSEEGAIPAAAGIGILIKGMEDGSKNAIGFKGMMEAQSKTMAGLMSTFKDTVRNAFVDGFNKYVPKISTVFEEMIAKVGPIVESIINVMGYLVSQIGQILGGIYTVLKPVFENFLLPALKLVGAGALIVLTAFAKLGAFMKQHAGVVSFLTNVIAIGALGYAAYRVQIMLATAVTKAHALWTAATTKATAAFTTAQKMLNATMAFNPIGLIVAALTALVAGFIIAWNHSETFRKVVIAIGKAGVIAFGYIIEWVGKLVTGVMSFVSGPMRLLLKGLSMLKVPGTKNALEAIEGGIKSVGKFFDKTATSVKNYADKLDGLANKKIKLPSFKLPGATDTKDTGTPKISDSTFNFDPSSITEGIDETGKKIAEKVAELKITLKEVVQGYNDFITNDFAKGFVDGAENARDTILKGLDELKNVFDAQKAIFEAQNNTAGIAKINSEWNKVNEAVRSRIAAAMAVAAELEDVSSQLDDAYSKLKEAITARTQGAEAFQEMLRTPFGTESDVQKALASGEASVDSIINMYDRMRDALDKRFEGIGGGKKDEIVNYLTDQTAKLVALAKRRDLAAKALEEAQKHLDDVLSKQASFKSGIVDSIKSFGTALADLSKANGDNTIKVIKTASGLVITQMSTQKSGVDLITDKLKTNLQTIKDFTTNIQTLLAKGYNKEYVRQLLEAGPEAAGATAALLAQSGSDTMATVNDLYTQINSASEQFGSTMSETFYGNAVAMAQAMVKGAQSEYDNIMKEMKSIADGIAAKLAPLKDVGTNVGNDLIQAMINQLEKRRAELVALAQSIAAQIAAIMAAAAASINVNVSSNTGGNTNGDKKDDGKPSDDAQKELDDALKALEDAMKGLEDSSSSASATLDALGKSSDNATKGTKTITAKSGDTVSEIAKKAGSTLAEVLALNPKLTDNAKYKDGNMIWSGTTIKVPTTAKIAVAPKAGGAFTDSQNAARLAGQSNTVFEKGAVNISLGQDIPAADVEPMLVSAFTRALMAR